MSTFYVEKNSENAKDLFYKRTIYHGNMRALEKPNVVDFNFGEKFLYGRVNRQYIPMVLDFNNPNLTLLNYNSTKAGEPIRGVNFVVDAFNEMVLQFAKCLANGQLNEKDKYLSSLTVHRAYTDPITLYGQHRHTYYDAIKKQLQGQNISILNFDDCIREVMPLIKKSGPEFPFTLSAFVKSSRCPINASGLAVEIADLKCDNDRKKVDEFLNSPNWEFYVNTCNSYGFMVDQNVPWRLVCDLASPTCLAKNYNFDDLASILQFGYQPAPLLYFENFAGYLYQLYTLIKAPYGIEATECENGDMGTRIVDSITYTQKEFMAHYDEEYFLNLYFEIRLVEEKTNMNDAERKSIIEEALEFSRARSTPAAIIRFEQIINKPFDIVGSLSYNIKQQRLMKENPDEVEAEVIAKLDAQQRALEKEMEVSDPEWIPEPGWSEKLYEDVQWTPVDSVGLGLDDDPGALD